MKTASETSPNNPTSSPNGRLAHWVRLVAIDSPPLGSSTTRLGRQLVATRTESPTMP